MSEREILADAATGLLAERCPERVIPRGGGEWLPELWAELEELGFTRVALPEAAGGAGASLLEETTVLAALAKAAAPVPAAETTIAAWTLAQAGVGVPPRGPLTIALAPAGADLEAPLAGVPWARICDLLAVVLPSDEGATVLAVPLAECELEPGENLAGEARDEVRVPAAARSTAAAKVGPGLVAELKARCALARAIQITAALERVLELTISQVADRRQFGRSIGAFQAVQQQVALLAGEAVAARAASAAAEAEAAQAGFGDPAAALAIDAAKVRTASAATAGSAIAHQLHGAIGITQEHTLGIFTRRLWSWREEWGSERECAARIGAAALRSGGWDTIVGAPSGAR